MTSVSTSPELEDLSEVCDTCQKEMGEEGQEHFCECGSDLTEEQCTTYAGFCEPCGWRINR